MICKDCLYEKLCPFNISGAEAERCKTYDPKDNHVKVVRCKDCKHRYADGWCKPLARWTNDDQYCDLGEKKEVSSEN